MSLYHAILEVEQAAARPAVAREQVWAQGVIEALKRLELEIDEHIEVTERAGGLYDEITDTAPRLTHKIQHPKDEHPQLRDTTRHLLARFLSTPLDAAWPVTDARDQV